MKTQSNVLKEVSVLQIISSVFAFLSALYLFLLFSVSLLYLLPPPVLHNFDFILQTFLSLFTSSDSSHIIPLSPCFASSSVRARRQRSFLGSWQSKPKGSSIPVMCHRQCGQWPNWLNCSMSSSGTSPLGERTVLLVASPR